jgi:predicted RNase H-like nuclease (RuvC/YqgF family)
MPARPTGDAPLESRFVREGKPAVSSLSAKGEPLTATELLHRVEELAEELARARASVEALTKTVEAERTARTELQEAAANERSKSRKLSAHVRQLTRAQEVPTEDPAELAEALERADALERQLGEAWGRIEQLRIQLAWATRPLWRRLLRLRPKSH